MIREIKIEINKLVIRPMENLLFSYKRRIFRSDKVIISALSNN